MCIRDRLLDEHGSQFTEGVLSGHVAVPLTRSQTFYVRHGEIFAQASAGVTAVALLFVAIGWARRRRQE
jgi:apolipoprotein N-acyltransferase